MTIFSVKWAVSRATNQMADISVMSIKAKANSLMKSGKYVEAIVEYSEAISLQPANPLLYSNRSLAFLKLSQYFFALKDAETTIRLVPDWAKGYYRKGQVELEVEMFNSAIDTFELGLVKCPGDEVLLRELTEVQAKKKNYLAWKRRTLRRYTLAGAFVGLMLVITDLLLNSPKSILGTPLVRWMFIITLAILAYLFRSVLVSLRQANKVSLIQPPVELEDSITNATLSSQSEVEYSDCLGELSEFSSSLDKSD